MEEWELKELEKISKRVERMPDWKKEGWARLEGEDYYCGCRKKSTTTRQKEVTKQ